MKRITNFRDLDRFIKETREKVKDVPDCTRFFDDLEVAFRKAERMHSTSNASGAFISARVSQPVILCYSRLRRASVGLLEIEFPDI